MNGANNLKVTGSARVTAFRCARVSIMSARYESTPVLVVTRRCPYRWNVRGRRSGTVLPTASPEASTGMATFE
ncbi:MAG: hypothetical protein J2P30_14165 [Actinobacteria bacterium]|nr:hypothetical protein [Actinomycetota bacterium]